MFTNDEMQYILNAVNEEVKRTGLQTAAIALTIAAKLQAEAQRMSELAKEETEPETE